MSIELGDVIEYMPNGTIGIVQDYMNNGRFIVQAFDIENGYGYLFAAQMVELRTIAPARDRQAVCESRGTSATPELMQAELFDLPKRTENNAQVR